MNFLANLSLVTLHCPCLEHLYLCQALRQVLSYSQCHRFCHSSLLFKTYYVLGTAHPSSHFFTALCKVYYPHFVDGETESPRTVSVQRG